MSEKTLLEEIQEEARNPKPKKVEQPKPKKKKFFTLRVKLWITALLAFAIIALIGALVYNKWSLSNQIIVRNPLMWRKPVYVEKQYTRPVVPVLAEEGEDLTKEQIIAEYEFADDIYRVWTLETGRGEAPEGYHKGCEAKGQTNEFGYGVWQGVCFDTFRESVEVVNGFFADQKERAVCYYNTGNKTRDCEYLAHFKSLQ